MVWLACHQKMKYGQCMRHGRDDISSMGYGKGMLFKFHASKGQENTAEMECAAHSS